MTEKEIICEKLSKTHILYNKCEHLRVELESIDTSASTYATLLRSDTRERNKRFVIESKKCIAKRPRLHKHTYNEMPEEPKKSKITSQAEILACGVLGLLIYGLVIFYAIFAILNLLDGGTGTYFAPIYVILVLIAIGLVLWGFIGKHGAYNMMYFPEKEKYDLEMELWESQFNEAASYVTGNGFTNDFCKFDKSFIDFTRKIEEEIKASEERYNYDVKSTQRNNVDTKNRLRAEYEATQRELASINVISPKYYRHAGRIRGVLNSGRADTLQEAINIALNDIRLEDEEKRRREEAARREELLRRQAEEARARAERQEELLRQQAQAAREQAEAAKVQADVIRKRSMCPRASSCYGDCSSCKRVK